LARALKGLTLPCQAEYPPTWEIEKKVMLGRDLREKPTVTDDSRRLPQSAPFLISLKVEFQMMRFGIPVALIFTG